MISGLISPKSIGFTNRQDINELLKKSKLIFKLQKVIIISMAFAAINLETKCDNN
jgi:hypothetical protein